MNKHGRQRAGHFFLYVYSETCEHSRSHIFGPIFMKFAQNVCLNDMLVEFKSGSGLLKNMVTSGRGSFPYLAIEKPCKHSRSHDFCPIIIKDGQNIGVNDISDEIENGYICLKNIASKKRGIFAYTAVYGYSRTLLTL